MQNHKTSRRKHSRIGDFGLSHKLLITTAKAQSREGFLAKRRASTMSLRCTSTWTLKGRSERKQVNQEEPGTRGGQGAAKDRSLFLKNLVDQQSCVNFCYMAKWLGYQSSSVTQSCLTPCDPWTAACQASLSNINSQSLLKLLSIESVIPSNHLILCGLLLLLPSIFPSIRVFSNESVLCIMWPKYWSFSFSINEYSGLISFSLDWLDLLAIQETLKSLLQHHCSKAPILQCSAFFTVQLLHLYMTTGKTIALTRWTFVGKVMPLWVFLFVCF